MAGKDLDLPPLNPHARPAAIAAAAPTAATRPDRDAAAAAAVAAAPASPSSPTTTATGCLSRARGVSYLAASLISFVAMLNVLFIPLATIETNDIFSGAWNGTYVGMHADLGLWDGCASLSECAEEPCFQFDWCDSMWEMTSCENTKHLWRASQAMAVIGVIGLVPSVILGGLDVLGKLGDLFCLSSRGILVLKAVLSVAVLGTFCALSLALFFDDGCVRQERFSDLPGFEVAFPMWSMWIAFVLQIACIPIAACLPPPPREDRELAKRRRRHQLYMQQEQQHQWQMQQLRRRAIHVAEGGQPPSAADADVDLSLSMTMSRPPYDSAVGDTPPGATTGAGRPLPRQQSASLRWETTTETSNPPRARRRQRSRHR